MSGAPRTLVLGAGIGGLTAAYRLLRAGAHVTVLEAADRVGGQIETEHRGGMLLEWGPDSLVAHKPAGERLCRELGLGDELLRLPSGGSRMQVVHRGRLATLPEGFLLIAPTKLGPLLRCPLLSPLGWLRAGLERFVPAGRATGDETLRDFVVRRWGRELYERVAEPVLGGLFSGDADRLSAAACLPRMRGLEREHGSVAAGLRAMATAAKPGAAPRGGVYALRGGMSALTDALHAHLPAGTVRTGTAVERLARDGSGWLAATKSGELRADAVVVAVPAFVAARLLAGTDDELANELRSVEYASVATVNLLYDASAVGRALHGFGFFVARSEGSPLLACNYTSRKFEGRGPGGCVMLRAFLGGAGRDPIDDLDDGELVRVAHEELAALLDLRGAPRFGRARKFRAALPQPVVGTVERRARLAAARPGLALCGTATGAVGLPDCIESAETAAARLIEAAHAGGLEQAG